MFISREFCFDVHNPNSILIFNSLKTARFVHCIEYSTSGRSCLYWIFENEKILTMLKSVLHCLYRIRDFRFRIETANAEYGVFH